MYSPFACIFSVYAYLLYIYIYMYHHTWTMRGPSFWGSTLPHSSAANARTARSDLDAVVGQASVVGAKKDGIKFGFIEFDNASGRM